MAVTITLTGKTPGQTQFGLETFTEHYKCDATANIVLTAAEVPQMGSAHPDYPRMFVTQRNVAETSESASALDLTYMGMFGLSELDLPLPMNTRGHSVASASSSSGLGGFALSPAATLQFYAPTNTQTWISTTPGDGGTVVVPTEEIVVFAFTFPPPYDFFTGDWYAFVRGNFFSELTTTVIQSTEIVADQYWQNVATSTKSLIAFAITV